MNKVNILKMGPGDGSDDSEDGDVNAPSIHASGGDGVDDSGGADGGDDVTIP